MWNRIRAGKRQNTNKPKAIRHVVVRFMNGPPFTYASTDKPHAIREARRKQPGEENSRKKPLCQCELYQFIFLMKNTPFKQVNSVIAGNAHH